jgi:hypothetical protein
MEELQYLNSMNDLFVKKYWAEDAILFYLHFQNGAAIRQIEVTAKGKVLLNVENPQKNDSILYDQSIDELNLQESDFITQNDFNNIWNNKL